MNQMTGDIYASFRPDTRCQAFEWPGNDSDRCDNAATVHMVLACRHEHVTEMDGCDAHLARSSDGLCPDCFAIDAHRCKLTGKALERIGVDR